MNRTFVRKIGTVGTVALAVMVAAFAGGRSALARPDHGHHVEPSETATSTPAPPPGDLNLHFGGYELVNGTTRLDIDGIGQVTSDASGNLSGAETYTAVNPAVPVVGSAETVCNGTITGTITPPSGNFASGNGLFSIALTYSPSSGAGSNCIPSTTTLLCSRTLEHWDLLSDLAAGRYRCIATGLTAASGASATISGASMRATINAVGGGNAPTS